MINFDMGHFSIIDLESKSIIAHRLRKYSLAGVICTNRKGVWQEEGFIPVTTIIDTSGIRDAVLYYSQHEAPILHPFDVGWVATVIESDNKSSINITKKTKTGNNNEDTRAHMGRYVSFRSHETPVSLLPGNNPVLSNTLMSQTGLCVPATLVSGKDAFRSAYTTDSATRESVFDRQR